MARSKVTEEELASQNVESQPYASKALSKKPGKKPVGWAPLGSDAARIMDPAAASAAVEAQTHGRTVGRKPRPTKGTPQTTAAFGDPSTVSKPSRKGQRR